jgi:hypothetical protein
MLASVFPRPPQLFYSFLPQASTAENPQELSEPTRLIKTFNVIN